MELNKQKAKPVIVGHDGLILNFHSMFATIQGEAIYAGCPAVFVRLANCTLQCPLCDTEYTEGARMVRYSELADDVADMMPPSSDLAVITGGEPLRQNLRPLTVALEAYGIRAQIETNGTCTGEHVPPTADVVCSPKSPKIHKDTESYVDAWKYVIEADNVDAQDGLPLSSLGMKKPPARPTNDRPVYIQPIDVQDDEANMRHTQAAVELCLQYGYRLCIQVHKLVDLP